MQAATGSGFGHEWVPGEAAELLEAASYLAGSDPLDEEHEMLVVSHPGLNPELDGLREDLLHTYNAASLDDLPPEVGLKPYLDPGSADYPIRAFAERWGLTPGQVAALAGLNPGLIVRSGRSRDRPGAGVVVRETPTTFIVQIPRPVTGARKEAVRAWLQEPQAAGRPEAARGIEGRRRLDQHEALIEALPWFDRWNAGEEPAQIWRSLLDEDPDLDFDALVTRLARIWESLRAISPTGLSPYRPSKQPA